MTMIQLYGRIGRDPEQRTTATGKRMTTASVVVDLSRNADEIVEWFSLAAFGKTGEVFLKPQ